MNILVVSPTPTHPPIAGNRARILALTHYLASRGHAVHFCWVAMEDGDESAMRAHFSDRFTRIVSSRPERAWRHRWRRGLLRMLGSPDAYQWGVDDWKEPVVVERLRQLARSQRFDVVMVEYVFMSYALAPGIF